MMYSLDEVALLPSATPVDIEHRSEVNPFDENGKLPIFVSPMTCIIDKDNYEDFKNSKFIPIIPRNFLPDNTSKNDWIACSLEDFKQLYLNSDDIDLNGIHVLIDIANGHMKCLYDIVRKAKNKYPGMIIMVGNIAHPQMYIECYNAGVDYVRCTVGTGSVCSTGMLTGIHCSHEYMLKGIKAAKHVINDPKATKIIMDGGISSIDRAIKCLALGADYIMMGRVFAQCEEACGYIVNKFPKKRAYYGMASEQGQIDLYGKVIKEPEGLLTHVEVNNTLERFEKQFEAALRSSMSYTGCHNLQEFRSNVEIEYQSIAEFKSYYKS